MTSHYLRPTLSPMEKFAEPHPAALRPVVSWPKKNHRPITAPSPLRRRPPRRRVSAPFASRVAQPPQVSRAATPAPCSHHSCPAPIAASCTARCLFACSCPAPRSPFLPRYRSSKTPPAKSAAPPPRHPLLRRVARAAAGSPSVSRRVAGAVATPSRC
jgi:hypothetical protein